MTKRTEQSPVTVREFIDVIAPLGSALIKVHTAARQLAAGNTRAVEETNVEIVADLQKVIDALTVVAKDVQQ